MERSAAQYSVAKYSQAQSSKAKLSVAQHGVAQWSAAELSSAQQRKNYEVTDHRLLRQAAMKISEAVPLDHPLDGDPEYCCADGEHRFHFRPGAPRRLGNLIWCCCKSVVEVVEE